MSVSSSKPESRIGRRLKMSRLTAGERAAIVRAAIAKRAFQISKSRVSGPGHELEDWRQAESEIVRPLNCGFLVSDHNFELSTDAACFAEGEIEICIEPRRLTICGLECARSQELVHNSASRLIVRSLELPAEIEPAEASASFKGRMIQMDLPFARAKQKAVAAR